LVQHLRLSDCHHGTTGSDSQRVGYAVSRSVKSIKFVGLDVHAETIAVAVAEQDGEVRSVGVIPNRCESVRKSL